MCNSHGAMSEDFGMATRVSLVMEVSPLSLVGVFHGKSQSNS
jgi:uncharacterized membrane protein YcjF (UPF0283 family)